eukprot:TRINITY_DN9493_c0_g1_i1.p1 TRINITY_DN9493_c0_g1~~TRINITY_DN9493_c0_g1_i1.p1  ORF type:complete len:132 (-),score=15.50 TRINITY_DN9493_c0_g1_i1:41-436(-)
MRFVAVVAVLFLCVVVARADDAQEEKDKEHLQGLINANQIMVFSKSYCPYCRRAKQTLDSITAKYEALELDQDPNGARYQQLLHKITGQRTVPNIFINGKHFGGSDAIVAAKENGSLQELLGGKEPTKEEL